MFKDYNMNQLVLPLDLEVRLQENDIAFAVHHIVADAGYGSQENYQDILMRRGRIPLIPYTMFEKEKSRKWRNDPFNTANWSYDERSDRFVCPNGQGRNIPLHVQENRSVRIHA